MQKSIRQWIFFAMPLWQQVKIGSPDIPLLSNILQLLQRELKVNSITCFQNQRSTTLYIADTIYNARGIWLCVICLTRPLRSRSSHRMLCR